MTVLAEKKRDVCEGKVNRRQLEYVSKFKYLEFFLDKSETDIPECCRKVESGTKCAVTIAELLNIRYLRLECARCRPEGLFLAVLIYGSKTRALREKDRSKIRYANTDNLRGLLGISRIDRIHNAWVKKSKRIE